MAVWVMTKPVSGPPWLLMMMQLKNVAKLLVMTELNPSWMTCQSRGSKTDSWHNQMICHQQNALILSSNVMTPLPTPLPSPGQHFLISCAHVHLHGPVTTTAR